MINESVIIPCPPVRAAAIQDRSGSNIWGEIENDIHFNEAIHSAQEKSWNGCLIQ